MNIRSRAARQQLRFGHIDGYEALEAILWPSPRVEAASISAARSYEGKLGWKRRRQREAH